MDWAHTTTRTIDLGYEQLLTFVGRPGTRVRVLYGAMWLTEEGRAQDIFAGCGDEVLLRTGGLSVVEGLGAARVQVIEPAARSLAMALARGASGLWRRLRNRAAGREALARVVSFALAAAVSVGVLHLAAPGPLNFQAAAADRAAARSQPVGAAGAVLRDVASAGTAFLAVN